MKRIIFLIMLLLVTSFVCGAEYKRISPETVMPGEEFLIVHTFSGIDQTLSHQELAVSEDILNELTLVEWDVNGAVKNDVKYSMDTPGTYNWIITPTATDVSLTLKVKATDSVTKYSYFSVVAFPPGDVETYQNPLDIKYECTENEIVTCDDGTSIIRRECVNNKYISTIEMCKDPTVIAEPENSNNNIKMYILEGLAVIVIFIIMVYFIKKGKEIENMDNETEPKE